MPIHLYNRTKPIIDYATPIVIEPQAEVEPGRMDKLFTNGQYNLCSQYTDFHCTLNSQFPSPSLPRDSALYEGYPDSGISHDEMTPPPAYHAYPAGVLEDGSAVEKLNNSGIQCEEYPTLGTVTMVQAAPIVIEPVDDDMAEMQQAYASEHTTPCRTPSHIMTTVPQEYLHGFNSCYQTPPPLHHWPGPAGYLDYSRQYTALGTLTPSYPVIGSLLSRNPIPPANQRRYQMLAPNMMNSGPWSDVAWRQVRPGHPYHSTPPPPPPPPQRTMTDPPLVIQPTSMHLQSVPRQIPAQANHKPEDDDMAIMLRCYAKKEVEASVKRSGPCYTKKETSVNISGTCYLHVDKMDGICRKGLSSIQGIQDIQMVVENQILEFDVDKRNIGVKTQKAGPPSEKVLIDDHYRSLEKQLPRYVKAHINSVTEKAAKHEEGIFFDNAVNMDLMQIEQACVKLSAFKRKLVYEHLSQFLPCSAETLRRHVDSLALAVVRQKLRNLMDYLLQRLEKEMPYQMERHLWECSVETKLQIQQQAMITQSPTRGHPNVMPISHQQPSAGKPVDQYHMPKKTFVWTDVTRQLIWSILKTKLSMFSPKKGMKAKIVNYERLTEFVQRQVVTAWPEGWMDTETVLTESRRVQQLVRGTSDLLVH